VFTFGREHEIQSAIQHVGNAEKARLLVQVIEGVHDLLEGKGNETDLANRFRSAFIEGVSGVWESSGSWLRKIGLEQPSFQRLWSEFAEHKRSEVRFRLACFVDVLPDALGEALYASLAADKSERVRRQAISKWEFRRGVRADV
jgi:hypothetical protein